MDRRVSAHESPVTNRQSRLITNPVDPKDRLAIIIGVTTAMLLAALDQTIVAPALPTIGAALGHTEYLSWVITAYLVTATAITPLYGKWADIQGRRKVIFVSMAIFVVGSMGCALAPNMFALIFARAFQGLGGGGLMALAITVIGDVVAPRERGQYMGYISGVWALSSIAGPIVGGLLSQHVHWSMIFWLLVESAGAANATFTQADSQRLSSIFTVVFATSAIALAVSVVCLFFMEEKPLRSSNPN